MLDCPQCKTDVSEVIHSEEKLKLSQTWCQRNRKQRLGEGEGRSGVGYLIVTYTHNTPHTCTHTCTHAKAQSRTYTHHSSPHLVRTHIHIHTHTYTHTKNKCMHTHADHYLSSDTRPLSYVCVCVCMRLCVRCVLKKFRGLSILTSLPCAWCVL